MKFANSGQTDIIFALTGKSPGVNIRRQISLTGWVLTLLLEGILLQ
jgi:hypothetical protein